MKKVLTRVKLSVWKREIADNLNDAIARSAVSSTVLVEVDHEQAGAIIEICGECLAGNSEALMYSTEDVTMTYYLAVLEYYDSAEHFVKRASLVGKAYSGDGYVKALLPDGWLKDPFAAGMGWFHPGGEKVKVLKLSAITQEEVNMLVGYNVVVLTDNVPKE